MTSAKNAHVSEDIVAQLPILTAGHTEPILKYEAEECRAVGGWDNHLFLTALKQVEPDALPTLFEVRWSWKDLGAALAGGGSGATVGAGVGAGVGAVFSIAAWWPSWISHWCTDRYKHWNGGRGSRRWWSWGVCIPNDEDQVNIKD